MSAKLDTYWADRFTSSTYSVDDYAAEFLNISRTTVNAISSDACETASENLPYAVITDNDV